MEQKKPRKPIGIWLTLIAGFYGDSSDNPVESIKDVTIEPVDMFQDFVHIDYKAKVKLKRPQFSALADEIWVHQDVCDWVPFKP